MGASPADDVVAAINWLGARSVRDRPDRGAGQLEAARQLGVPIALVQAENDYSTAPTRALAAELARLGKPHTARVYPSFGLTADEGHLFSQKRRPSLGGVGADVSRSLAQSAMTVPSTALRARERTGR